MRYRGRHRRVASFQQRIERVGTVAALVAAAVVAPVALERPAPSDAATSAASTGTLLGHPEWRVPAGDSRVSATVEELKAMLTSHGVVFDPAEVAAYRVPTVWGFRTLVTAKPAAVTVRPNPNLAARTADGVTTITPSAVLSRLIAPSAQGGVGDVVPAVQVYDKLPSIPPISPPQKSDFDDLIQYIRDIIGTPEIGDPGPRIENLKTTVSETVIVAQNLAAEAIAAAIEIIGPLPTTEQLVQQVLDLLASIQIADVEQAKQQVLDAIEALGVLGKVRDVLNSVPDPYAAIEQIAALIDSIGPVPTIDPLTLATELRRLAEAHIDALLEVVGLPPLAELDVAALVVDIVNTPISMANPDEWTVPEVEARYAQYRERINALLAADGTEAGVNETIADEMSILSLSIDGGLDAAAKASSTGSNVTMYQPRYSYDTMLRKYVMSASWAWNICSEYNRACWTNDTKSSGAVGGPDGIGLKINRVINRYDNGMSTSDNCGYPALTSFQPDTAGGYGVGFREQDSTWLENYMCKGTPFRYNWHRGTVSVTFTFRYRCNASTPIQVDARMSHTWYKTSVNSIGISTNGITFSWSQDTHRWTVHPRTPAYGGC